MRKIYYFALAAVLMLGFVAWLYRFNNPIADWHSWRQADTSAVSRNFVNSGFDVLHPRFDDLSNVPSGVDNPQGYRFVEFPFYNIAQAGVYKLFGHLTLEEWGRLITIFSSVATSLLIFLILKHHQKIKAGLLGAFFFSLLPFSIYYGRTILPDPSTAMVILAAIYSFDLWTDKARNRYFAASLFLTAVALLLKPFAVFFALPITYLFFDKFGWKFLKKWQLWVFGVLSVSPLLAWRVWMSQFPEGIPFSAWLFNDGNIRFKGAYFYWIFGERIGKLISGYFGVSLLTLGLISKFKSNRELVFFYSFVVSSFAYMVVVARGNVQHDYYQILIMPTIAIFMGLGAAFLLDSVKTFTNKFIGPILFLFLTFLTLILSWYYIRDYFNINNPSIVLAGQAVDRLTPKDAKVIANYDGDTSFLYQTKRKGWASYEHTAPEMVKLGADYLVDVNPSSSDFDYAKGYKIIDRASDYVIFDLRQEAQ